MSTKEDDFIVPAGTYADCWPSNIRPITAVLSGRTSEYTTVPHSQDGE